MDSNTSTVVTEHVTKFRRPYLAVVVVVVLTDSGSNLVYRIGPLASG